MSILPPLPARPGAPNLLAQHAVPGAESIDAATTYYWTGDFAGFRVTGTLTSAGLLWGSGAAGALAVDLAEGGSLSNDGTIIAEAASGTAVAVAAEEAATSGSIAIGGALFALAAAGNAYGIRILQPGDSVSNSGTIAAQAFADPADANDAWLPLLSGEAIGIAVIAANVPITNAAAGQILAEGDRAVGIWMRGSTAGSAANLDNQGSIHAGSTLAGSPSCGLILVETPDQQMHVVNSGTIEADVAIFAPSEGPDTLFDAITYGAEVITNAASGTILGAIALRNGDDQLVNHGRIAGAIDMGPGNDRLDTADGSIEGIVHLGLGDDLFLGSSGADRATGDGGNDRLDGNAGADLLLGGTGDDALTGGASNDGLYGEFGNDRLVVEGGDRAFGGSGDDRIELGGYDFALADGGADHDTLVLPSGARILDLSAVAASGRVAGIEQIVLGGDKQLVVRPADIAAISGATELTIDALGSDTVDLVGNWLERPQQTVGGTVYRVFASNGSSLLVELGATIVNGATVPAGAAGLDPVASGDAAPQAGDSTGLDADQGLTILFDPDEIAGTQVRVESYETWDNVEGRAVFSSGDVADAATGLTNFGQVSSSGAGPLTAAVDLARGSIDNSGTVWADNSGAGNARAVLIGTSGTLVNRGQVTATAITGDAVAMHSFDVRAGASVTNMATGYVTAFTTSGQAAGIRESGAAAVIRNDGTIEVAGGAGGIGVDFSEPGGTLLNSGAIYASGTGASAVGIGLADLGSGSLVNAGLISAEIAVAVTLRAGDTFAIDNSGTLDGAIQATADPDSAGSSATLDVTNSGTIAGPILIDPASRVAAAIHNNGAIAGDLGFARGADFYDGSGGALAGAIFAGDGADTLIGGAAPDAFHGDGGDDLLTGGGGADSLAGGPGADRFVDTAAGHDGDTIADFGAGDAIVITDATLAGFTFSLSGNRLTFTGGALTLSTVPAGTIVASASAQGGVQLSLAVHHQVHNDFNGDGRSDILWRADDGSIFDFLGTANGGYTNNGDNSFLNVASTTHVAATGDFNGDGRADILWRDGSGAIFNYLATAAGGFTDNSANSFVSIAADTHVAATGDFNGDGHSDILWRNDAGVIFNFLGTGNGGFVNNGDNSYVSVALDTHVAATGDFNGDGLDDILWRNDAGQMFDFLGTANGGYVNNGDNSFVNVGTEWHVAGTGDFNGDGRADILWRNDDGTIFDFLGTADGGFTSNGDNSSVTVGNEWHIASVGDFNGDAVDDILWRNDNGTIFDFLGKTDGGFMNNGDNSFVAASLTVHIQDPFF